MKKLIILLLLIPALLFARPLQQKLLAVIAAGGVESGGGGSFTVYQGGYSGNGIDRDIPVTGLVSSSDALILIANNGGQSGAMRFPAQSGGLSSEWADSQVEETNMIQGLKTDAFEVGTTYEVNNTNTYAYCVIDNNSSENVEYGTYAGNGVDGRTISLSIMSATPDLVIVKSAGAAYGAFHTHDMGDTTDISAYFTILGNAANRIQAVGAGAFEVSNSSTMNGAGVTYYYAAFVHVEGAFVTGAYTGNGVDDRSTTGIGFQPDIVIIKADNTQGAVIHTTAMGASTDLTYFVRNRTSITDAIPSLDSNGFEIGTDISVNENGTDYYWMAWKTGEYND